MGDGARHAPAHNGPTSGYSGAMLSSTRVAGAPFGHRPAGRGRVASWACPADGCADQTSIAAGPSMTGGNATGEAAFQI